MTKPRIWEKHTLLTALSLADAFARADQEPREKAAAFFADFTQHGPEELQHFGRPEPVEGRPGLCTLELCEGWKAVLSNPVSGVWTFLWLGKEASVKEYLDNNVIVANPRVGAIQVFRPLKGETGWEECAKEEEKPKGRRSRKKKTEDAEALQEPEMSGLEEAGDALAEPAMEFVRSRSSGSGLFCHVTDRELLDIGVPERRLDLVRSFASLEDLKENHAFLPAAAALSLWRVGCQGRAAKPQSRAVLRREVRASDYLESDETRSLFCQPESREDFAEWAKLPLEPWRSYLSDEQRQIVETVRPGAFMVIGAAGTGKTVVALHRAKHLVTLPDWGRSDRLLFTTFTRNLTADLKAQLEKLIPEEKLRRCIDVVNLDEWVHQYLLEHGFTKEFIYEDSPELAEIWERARGLIPRIVGQKAPKIDFYKAEFQQMVLSNRVLSAEDYLRVDRTGRGITLGKRERLLVWPVFDFVRKELDKTGKIASQDAFYLARDYVIANSQKPLYRAVIVDEAQDFGNEAFRLLRALTPDLSKRNYGKRNPKQGDIFIAGDDSQRIYARSSDLFACGINVKSRRTKMLTKNFRTTGEIRSAALLILENNIKKQKEAKRQRRLYRDECCEALRSGPAPELYTAKGAEDEAAWIAARIRSLQEEDRSFAFSSIVVAAHSKKNRDEYAELLRGKGIPVEVLDREAPGEGDAVRVATLHRIKGLEFKAVFIAGADDGKIPHAPPKELESGSWEMTDYLRRQRALFAMAATRARDRLFVSCREKPGPFMRALAPVCTAA